VELRACEKCVRVGERGNGEGDFVFEAFIFDTFWGCTGEGWGGESGAPGGGEGRRRVRREDVARVE